MDAGRVAVGGAVVGPSDREDVHLVSLRERLAREVAVLKAVRHPALVPLLAATVEGERPFLVFPHYRGGDLKARLEHGPLDPRGLRALGLRLALERR